MVETITTESVKITVKLNYKMHKAGIEPVKKKVFSKLPGKSIFVSLFERMQKYTAPTNMPVNPKIKLKFG